MASITITATGQCSGGNHLRISVTGEFSRTYTVDAAQVKDMDAEDLQTFVLACINLAKRGRTVAQLKNALQAGLVVNL